MNNKNSFHLVSKPCFSMVIKKAYVVMVWSFNWWWNKTLHRQILFRGSQCITLPVRILSSWKLLFLLPHFLFLSWKFVSVSESQSSYSRHQMSKASIWINCCCLYCWPDSWIQVVSSRYLFNFYWLISGSNTTSYCRETNTLKDYI